MDRSGQVFSYIIFWLENCIYYIPLQVITEVVLIPFIYLRMVYNIMKVESFLPGIGFSSLWLLIGLPFLLYTAAFDVYFYFKVLCDYRELDFDRTTENEDRLQDKIVIYNEIIDTIRSIMNIFKHKKRQLAKTSNIKSMVNKGNYKQNMAHKKYEMPTSKADSDNDNTPEQLRPPAKFDQLENIAKE